MTLQLYKPSQLAFKAPIPTTILLLLHFLILALCLLHLPNLRRSRTRTMNPWSFPTPPTLTPFPSNTSAANLPRTLTNTSSMPERPRVIPHLPVFLITRPATAPPSPMQEPTPTSRHPRKWRFKLQMSLTFRCHMSLPKILSPSKWLSKPPRPVPIIPVMPNYELMKTPTTPWTEDRPPSYHLQPYTPPRPT
jgi:hypothetical protein